MWLDIKPVTISDFSHAYIFLSFCHLYLHSFMICLIMHNDLNVQVSNKFFNENNIDKISEASNELNMHLSNILMAENINEASNELNFHLSNTLITENNINEASNETNLYLSSTDVAEINIDDLSYKFCAYVLLLLN